MAACVVEDAIITSIHCQAIQTTMQQSLSSSSFETINQHYPLTFPLDAIQMDSRTLTRNPEIIKKRQLNRSNTYSSANELARAVADNSWPIQTAPTNNQNETSTVSSELNALLLADSADHRSTPLFRTCLSYPTTSSDIVFSIEDNSELPFKFTSLPVLTSPRVKRLRPQTINCSPTNLSVPILPKDTSTSPPPTTSSIQFVDSSELADKLKDNFHIIIFDCGSPFRYNENHICHANLLRVADKISRKRLKSNPTKHSTLDIQQLNECDFVVLYDDNTDNHLELSAGLKCAIEEIQRCLTTKHPSTFILRNSFSQFSTLHPNFCQSFQSSSSPTDDLSAQLTPISPSTDLHNRPMTHIINGLYIGSEANAKDLDELSSEQIQHIVNVTSHVPLYHLDRFHYCHIPADDTQKQNLLDYFDQAYTFIRDALGRNEKVLVHCVAGISRSPAIVISFLMRHTHMNMNEAYEFVKQKRSIVSPNLNFLGQLLQYERTLQGQP